MPRNSAQGAVGRYGLSVHNASAPSAEELEALLNFIREGKFEGVLAFSAGWAPDAATRNRFRSVSSGLRVAVMIDSAVGRVAISLLSMFMDIKGFPLDAPEAATDYLRVPAAERSEFLAMLEKLKGEVGITASR